MIVIERLSNCSLTDVLDAWNNGFKGYYTDMTMTIDRFLQRMVQEGFSADDSIVAFVNRVPAGIVLNGFRNVEGKLIGYNGGTAVAPEFRRMGVGKRMMEAVIDLYKQKGVDEAHLEAIHDNHAAIKLYESLGYSTSDRVFFLQQQGPIRVQPKKLDPLWAFETKAPHFVQHLDFYDCSGPWQTQWQSVGNGDALVVSENGRDIGYGLYRKVYDPYGMLSTIVLHQIEVNSSTEKREALIDTLLHKIFEPTASCKRLVINLSNQKRETFEAIRRLGFSTMVEQVCMNMGIKESIKPNATRIREL
ncbi:GNAT family N-acetyltransferase [Pseudalkalibacillus berkeleyi]|uniref:GNAT family N-acetyltransferase n=1 Tax=Pseudalkalibacillus berkeleyi TaxID=1069813 RepID=A0ABS9GYM0_9BACL|nr:GNAT family N-acetyltransferase [Pseudalkalibacillus berkeleyi]MCF6137784.1 GNAT family N-acetyltransferase [Pseudalkalibacillus berkeleyi]